MIQKYWSSLIFEDTEDTEDTEEKALELEANEGSFYMDLLYKLDLQKE